MNDSASLLARRQAVVPPGVGSFAGTTTISHAVDRGRFVDFDGKEYIDLAGGIGVNNVGHTHPEVVAAIKEQSAKLLHACFHVATYEPYVELCEKLVELVPHIETPVQNDLMHLEAGTQAFLVNTGAEAVENCVKIARQVTQRPAIICYSEAFHGRTLLGMSLTSKVGYKMYCGPFAPEIYRIQYPNHFHYGGTLSEDAYVDRQLERLREAFTNVVPAEHVAAILIEPVQGEGGFVPAPPRYMQELRSICDEYGILLICDEVQTGFGRTGTWAAFEHQGIKPDLSSWAKSMGGGMPIGCVIGKKSILEQTRPGTLGGTYGGNPVACAAALATIRVMEKEGFMQHALEIGGKTRAMFESLRTETPHVGEVRGIGAMIAAEFSLDGNPMKPASAIVTDGLARARDRGVLAIPAGAYGNIIRILSPLTISDEDLDKGLDILRDSILQATRELQTA